MLARIAVVFLLLTTLCCTSREKTAEDFYPLKEGTTREYQCIDFNESGRPVFKLKLIETVLAPREIDGIQIRPLKCEYITPLGNEIKLYFIVNDIDGIYMNKKHDSLNEKPISFPKAYLLMNPIKVRTRNTVSILTISIDSINENVTVPAGTFTNCVKVRRTIEKHPPFSDLTWFCQGLGPVKSIQYKKYKGKIITQLIKYKVPDQEGITNE